MVTRRKGGRIGVPAGTYEALCAVRGEVCWICGWKRDPEQHRRLHIDHDHRSLRVRGLTCYQCNRRLFKGVTAEWCAKAGQYLQEHEADPLVFVCRDPEGDWIQDVQEWTK